MRRGATLGRVCALLVGGFALTVGALPGISLLAAAGAEPGVRLVFQAVRCDGWGRVPGNLRVDPSMDDTGGHYREWGPVADGVVSPYDDTTLPVGCSFFDGVPIRLSASRYGLALLPAADEYEPPGSEDGSSTTRLGVTGSDGHGQVSVDAAGLPPAQRRALFDPADDGGLWVAVDLSGLSDATFANLRCHRDRYNADNREVIRPDLTVQVAACVAFFVGPPPPPGPSPSPAPPPGSPTPAPGPVPGPVPPPTGPPAGGGSPPAPSEPAPGPSTSAGPGGDLPPGPGPAGPPGATAGSAAAQPPGGGEATAPAPAEPGSTAAVPAGPTTPAPSSSPTAPGTQSPGPGPAPSAPAAGTPPSPPPSTGAEQALGGRPTSMSLVVEVDGVTGASVVAAGAGSPLGRSPWVRPVVVQLTCDDGSNRRVEVPVGQPPGYRASAVVSLASGHSCRVQAADAGVASGASDDVALRVDGASVNPGDWVTVQARPGDQRQVRVNVTFSALAVQEPTPPQRRPVGAAGDQPVPLTLTLSLAAVFALGVVGAVIRSRRPV